MSDGHATMDSVTASTAPRTPRGLVDRCPGLLRPHQAADGALIRLRLPGGRITAAALAGVSAAAVEFGNGQVQLTSRGNLQLRGVQVDPAGAVAEALVDRISAAGLLPSATHELVRNIVCSPLSGRIGGLADLGALIADLDQIICETPELAGLPGRFLFGLDDGRGDISELEADIELRAMSSDRAVIMLGGFVGPEVAVAAGPACMVEFAKRFLQAKADAGGVAWHVRDLPQAGAELLPRSGRKQTQPKRAAAQHPYGILAQRDGRSVLSLVVPLGLLSANQVDAVIGAADREVIVTPWRGLLIPDLTQDVDRSATSLTGVGLSLNSASGWSEVSACTGAPGCNNADASTRPVAAEMVDVVRRSQGLPVHVVACERRCGAPATRHVEIALGQANWQVAVRSPARNHNPRGSGSTTDMSALAHVVAQARNGL